MNSNKSANTKRVKSTSSKLKLKEWDYQCKDNLRQEAHQALKDEFSAAQERARSEKEKISLESGIYQGKIAEKHCYRFRIAQRNAKEIDADRPHVVEVHGNQVDGNIISVSETFVDIALAEYFGKVLPLLDLVFDLSLLIDLVDRRVVEIDRNPKHFCVGIASQLFGSLNWASSSNLDCLLNHKNRRDNKELSNEQMMSVRDSLVKTFRLIWGPPGTGKTITLIGVIAEFLAHGKRVLFASNTNSAIDNVLLRIA